MFERLKIIHQHPDQGLKDSVQMARSWHCQTHQKLFDSGAENRLQHQAMVSKLDDFTGLETVAT